jgi:prepilin-type N-terminal cleavage/methylation domain-containing protein
MQRRVSQAGFTLIELSIGLLLTGILVAAIFGLLSTSLESRMRGDRSIELQQTARYAMDLMVRELQYATRITAVAPTSITFQTEQFGAKTITYSLARGANNASILRRNQQDSSGDQPVTGGGDQVIVSINELLFEILTTSSSGQPLSVGIQLTVTDLAVNELANRPSYHLRTAVTGMNIPR